MGWISSRGNCFLVDSIAFSKTDRGIGWMLSLSELAIFDKADGLWEFKQKQTKANKMTPGTTWIATLGLPLIGIPCMLKRKNGNLARLFEGILILMISGCEFFVIAVIAAGVMWTSSRGDYFLVNSIAFVTTENRHRVDAL